MVAFPGQQISLDNFGADRTGTAFSDSAMILAQEAGGSGAYQINAGPGNYKFAGSYNFGRMQGFAGPGSAYTTFTYTGSGTFLNVWDPSFSSSLSVGGRFGGFAINGYGAGAGAVGMRWGDLNRGRCNDIAIAGFNAGTASTGLYMHNVNGWSEQAEWTAVNLVQNSTNVRFDTNSFDYSLYQFVIVADANQDGLRMENTAALAGCRIELRGNFKTGVSNTGAVIAMDRLNTSTGACVISQALFDVVVECDGSGTGHIAILQDGGNAATQFNGYGALVFTPETVAFQNASFTGSYGFAGNIQIPGLGYMDTTDAFTAQGASQWYQSGNTSSNFAYAGMLIYPGNGDYQAFILPNGAITVGGFNGSNYARTRKITIMFKQPASGAAGTITWPANVKWRGGTHALSAANNAIDKVTLTYFPGDTEWYGEVDLAYA
jgi:hypothetical protein